VLVSQQSDTRLALKSALSAEGLKLGTSNDQHEQEADRVAEKVVLGKAPAAEPAPNTLPSATAVDIQRVCSACEEQLQLEPEDDSSELSLEEQGAQYAGQLARDVRAIRQGGRPLDDAQYFESRMGHDFAGVRVHDDSRAHGLAKRLQARAFTHGSHIVFGTGQHNPGSTDGRLLLAHELAHVVQQRAAPATAGALPSLQARPDAPNMQGGLLDGAEALWDSGTDVIADTASNVVDTVVTGARVVGGVVVSGARAVGDTVIEGVRYVGGIAVDAYESVRDLAMAVLREYAPALLAFMQGDIVQVIKDMILDALDSLFNGLGQRIREEGIAGALSGVFSEFAGTTTQIASDLASGNCDSLFAAIRSLGGFAERLFGPAFDGIRRLMSRAGSFLGGLWADFGAPVWDGIKKMAGGVWDWITRQASRLWEWTAPIRRFGAAVWNEYKRLFNVAWTETGSALEWLKEKAVEAWNAVMEFLGPLAVPVQILLGILALFTPFGPVVAIGVGLPLLWNAITWLRENWNDFAFVVRGREILHEQILPALQTGLQTLQGLLDTAATWIAEMAGLAIGAITQVLAALGVLPILRSLVRVVSGVINRIMEGVSWLLGEFVALLLRIKDMALRFLRFIQPILVLLAAIILFPVNPWILTIVLAGWAWRFTPDCFKPPIINFWIDAAIAVVSAMPDFEMFGPAWAQAKAKIIETLQTTRGLDDDTKIAASNGIAKLMTGEDFTWIANLAKAAWQMPSHFMGKVQEELVGSDLSQPLAMELLPSDILSADGTASIDSAASLLGKPRLAEGDVVVEPVATTTWDAALLRELNIPDGGEVPFGGGMPPDIASPQGVADEIAQQDAAAAGGDAVAAPIPTDTEEQLEGLMSQPLELECGQNEKTEEPATAEQVPPQIRQYGPFTPMQRFRYTMNRMGAGLSHWFNCNKHWLVPTLIVAIIALIAAVVLTEGAALGVIGSVLEIVAAIMIGVSLVRMTYWLGEYLARGIAGQIPESAGALAKAIAVGAIELVFALLFALGPILKAGKGAFQAARASGRGVVSSLGAAGRGSLRATGAAARSAFVPTFEQTARIGTSLSRSAAVGGRNIRRIGGAIIERGRLIINGVQDGFASGIRSLRQLRRSLSRLRFRGFSISRTRMWFELWGHFNPKVLILAGPGIIEDASLAGAGRRPTIGTTTRMPGRRYRAPVIQVPNEGANRLAQAFEALSDAERRAYVRRLQAIAGDTPIDDAARRAILQEIAGTADDLGFSSTTQAMRDSVRGRSYPDPFRPPRANGQPHMATPPPGTVMSPDHIYPASLIQRMDGWDDLTRAQQRAIMHDTGGIVDNIQPLPKYLNESKGARIGSDWGSAGGQAVDPQYSAWLRQQQEAARQRIQRQIDTFLGR
jgi:hypothetical protein